MESGSCGKPFKNTYAGPILRCTLSVGHPDGCDDPQPVTAQTKTTSIENRKREFDIKSWLGVAASVAFWIGVIWLNFAPSGSDADGYTNVDGVSVQSPNSNSANATAVCEDGTYSHAQHRQGTCSHHGGVARWL